MHWCMQPRYLPVCQVCCCAWHSNVACVLILSGSDQCPACRATHKLLRKPFMHHVGLQALAVITYMHGLVGGFWMLRCHCLSAATQNESGPQTVAR